MTHEELRDLYELYALGVLDAEERREVESHLATGCESCRRLLQRAREINAIVMTLAPEIEPPRRLRKRVAASVGYEKPAWGWVTSWAAVSAALFLAVLWLSVRDRRQAAEIAGARRALTDAEALVARVEGDYQKARAVLDFLNQPETQLVVAKKTVTLPPKARVFLNKNRGVLLLADNLPPAPAGRIYEMWVIPKGGAPKPAGLFNSDPRGNAMHLLAGPIDVSATAAVAVTLEPESGSPAPTTTPILVTGL